MIWWFNKKTPPDDNVEDEAQELSARAKLPIPDDAFSRWINQPLREHDD